MPQPQPYEKRIKYLGISLEKGTPNVPDDGRYHVLDGTSTYYSTGSLTLAEAHLEMLEDEKKAAHPELKNPRDLIRAEAAFSDIMGVKGDAKNRRTSQEQAKGGKGGRSGV